MKKASSNFLLLFISTIATSGWLYTTVPVIASDVFTLESSDTEEKQKVFDRQAGEEQKIEQLRLAGDESLRNGDADAAMATYDRALKIRFSIMVGLGKAKALIKLHRLAEAVAILKKVNDVTVSIDAWKMRVECHIKLKQYADAYAVCDEIRQSGYPEDLSFLLRAQTLKAQNRKEEAKKCLLDGIAHCIRYGAEKQDLVDELYALGSEPPDGIPRCTNGNKQLLAAIKELVEIKSPLNQRELFAKFHEQAYPASISGTGKNPVASWGSIRRSSPIEGVGSNDNGDINLVCDLDQSFLTPEDLKQFGTLQKSSLSDSGGFVALACPNGQVRFHFSEQNPQQLHFAKRTFDEPSSDNSSIADFNYVAFETEIIQLINHSKYREAQNKILQNWQCVVNPNNPAIENSKRKKMRDLLIKTEKNRPQVQEYLKQACIPYITEDVECKNRFGIDFPTAREYNSFPWHQHGVCCDPALPDSYYVIYKETYPAINVRQQSMLFRRLYANAPKASESSSKIEAPPQNLLDDAYELSEKPTR